MSRWPHRGPPPPWGGSGGVEHNLSRGGANTPTPALPKRGRRARAPLNERRAKRSGRHVDLHLDRAGGIALAKSKASTLSLKAKRSVIRGFTSILPEAIIATARG